MDMTRYRTTGLMICLCALMTVSCGKAPNVIGILAEGAPQVASDGQGNFFTTWQSANAIMVRHYPQGVAQPPLRLGYGKTPSVTVGRDGVAYVAWQGNENSNDRGHVRHFQPSENRWLSIAETGAENTFRKSTMQQPIVTATPDFAFMTWSSGGTLSKTGTAQFFNMTHSNQPTPIWAYEWYPWVRAIAPSAPQYASTVSHSVTGPTGSFTGSTSGYSHASGEIHFDYACDAPVTASAGFTQTMVLCLANRTESGMDRAVWNKNTKLYAISFNVPNYSQIIPYVVPFGSSELIPFDDRVYAHDYDMVMDAQGNALAVWSVSWQPTTARPNRDDNFFYYQYATFTPNNGWTAPQDLSGNQHVSLSPPKLTKDDQGNIFLINREIIGNDRTIQLRRFSFASGWQPSEQLYSGSASAMRPHLAVSPSGDLLAVWESDGAITMTRRNMNATQWLPAIEIGKGDWPHAALDNNGRCVVVWKDGSDVKEFSCADPIPVINYSPDTVELGVPVTFDASGSRDEDGSIEFFEWDFTEDGQADAFFATSQYTFNQLGDVEVMLTVTDNDGRMKSATVTITVVDGQINLPPTANYVEVSQMALIGGTQVELNAAASTDIDGTIDLYRWDVNNDGTYDFETTTPAITLSLQPGLVPVRLQVVDDEGASADFIETIEVEAIFNADPQLTVVITGGPGIGEVRTNEEPIPNFICTSSGQPSTTCSEPFLVDTVIVLIAEANQLPATYDWTGCDFVGEGPNGTSACRVTFLADTTISVNISSP